MKKLLAVLMAVLVAFSALSVVVFAADVNDGAEDVGAAEAAPAAENDVTPKNFVQLTLAFFTKAFEKFSNFVIGLFGENSDRVNIELAQAVYDVMNKLFGTTNKADIITTQAAA